MADLVITTARRQTVELLTRAHQWARTLGAPVVPRRGRAVEVLCAEEGVVGALVVEADRDVYYEPSRKLQYFFHPNLASVRIRNLQQGAPDHMVQAMQLGPGDHVLDCTMGRGADAIICAWVVGESGRVVALEKVPVIAHLTMEGLRRGYFVGPRFTAIMRRVDARCADYDQFLPQCEARSFDVVYFDPLFHEPVAQSRSMESLRALAHAEALTSQTLQQARRVARRCVVIKQRRGTPLWEELGVTQVYGGKQSRVEYGVVPAF